MIIEIGPFWIDALDPADKHALALDMKTLRLVASYGGHTEPLESYLARHPDRKEAARQTAWDRLVVR